MFSNLYYMSNQYITIKEASNILGVSALTLRNWDNNGKLKALRHPINNYRVYKKEDLETLIGEMKTSPEVPKIAKNPKREFKKVIVKHIAGNQ